MATLSTFKQHAMQRVKQKQRIKPQERFIIVERTARVQAQADTTFVTIKYSTPETASRAEANNLSTSVATKIVERASPLQLSGIPGQIPLIITENQLSLQLIRDKDGEIRAYRGIATVSLKGPTGELMRDLIAKATNGVNPGGIIQLESIRYAIENDKAYTETAVKKATEAARDYASAAVGALGLELGHVMEIDASTRQGAVFYGREKYTSSRRTAPTRAIRLPIAETLVDVTATVVVKFYIAHKSASRPIPQPDELMRLISPTRSSESQFADALVLQIEIN